MPIVSVDALEDYVGKAADPTAWVEVTQDNVNRFADVTGDHQFIHVDEAQAALTPMGGTIAHGFYILSLLANWGEESGVVLQHVKMGLNYGFETVRFLSPVRVGRRVRGHFTLLEVSNRARGQYRFVYDVSVEIEGEEKPALAARWIALQFV